MDSNKSVYVVMRQRGNIQFPVAAYDSELQAQVVSNQMTGARATSHHVVEVPHGATAAERRYMDAIRDEILTSQVAAVNRIGTSLHWEDEK